MNEGENATLACKAAGNPLPRITWKREDGQKIAMKNKPKKILRKKIRYYNNRLNLLIKSVFLFFTYFYEVAISFNLKRHAQKSNA